MKLLMNGFEVLFAHVGVDLGSREPFSRCYLPVGCILIKMKIESLAPILPYFNEEPFATQTRSRPSALAR